MESIALSDILLTIIALEGLCLCYRLAGPIRPMGPVWRANDGALKDELPHSHECKTIGEQLQFIGCAVRDLLDQELRVKAAMNKSVKPETKGAWYTAQT